MVRMVHLQRFYFSHNCTTAWDAKAVLYEITSSQNNDGTGPKELITTKITKITKNMYVYRVFGG